MDTNIVLYVAPESQLPPWFVNKVTVGDGCWEWQGSRMRSGYGQVYMGRNRQGSPRLVSAHRLSYEFFIGPVPEGLEIDHLCANKACVRPSHLEAVTHVVNVRRYFGLPPDREPPGPRLPRTHCKRGHSLADAYVSKHGSRNCRVCIRLRKQEG